MILIGESLNSSIPSVRKAFEAQDRETVAALAKKQLECGADYLDINAGAFAEREKELLLWAVEIALEAGAKKIMVDTPDPSVARAVLERFCLKDAILNSVTPARERMEGLLPLAAEYSAGVVLLPVGGATVPKTAAERLAGLRELVNAARTAGIKDEQMYLDCVVEAAATDDTAPRTSLETVRGIKSEFPRVHITGGLSNVSFGLPARRKLNCAFLSAAVVAGLDSPITDVTSPDLRMAAMAGSLLAGEDEYCMEYITVARELM